MKIQIANANRFGEMFTLQRAAFVDEARLYGTPDIPALNQTFDEFVNRLAESKSWIAVDRNRIVGAVSLRSYRGDPDVERLMVAPDRRGEGTSTLLMNALERASYESGHRALQLIVGDAAVENQLIYKHLGWRRTSTAHLPGNINVVLHTMAKTLANPE